MACPKLCHITQSDPWYRPLNSLPRVAVLIATFHILPLDAQEPSRAEARTTPEAASPSGHKWFRPPPPAEVEQAKRALEILDTVNFRFTRHVSEVPEVILAQAGVIKVDEKLD